MPKTPQSRRTRGKSSAKKSKRTARTGARRTAPPPRPKVVITAGARTVREIMSRRPMTLRPTDDLALARQIMLWTGVHHLPVMEGERLVGLVTDHDLLSGEAEFGAEESRFVRARDVMHRRVKTIAPTASIAEATDAMTAQQIGCLPVLGENGTLLGIVTTTDLIARQSAGERPTPEAWETSARALMTADPVTALAEDTVASVISTMIERGIRHVPVVDPDGRLIGMVSDRDVRTAVGTPAEAFREVGESQLEQMRVEEVMSPDPVRVPLDASLREILALLSDERVGALPVVDEADRPVGIVSYVDVLAYLAKRPLQAAGAGAGAEPGAEPAPPA